MSKMFAQALKMVVPKLPMKKPATPKEIYENGRKFGLYQAEKIIQSHIGNTYPINCKSIIKEMQDVIE